METLILTPFFQSVKGGKEQQSWTDLFKGFVKSVFDLCHNTSIGYDKLIFILYYTHIELLSLINEDISEDAKKKCRKWTGKIIDLVEIIYAIDTKKCVDNGNISIIELSDHIGKCFGVCFKDCYSSYIDIRRRKNNSRTYFLDELSKSLNDRMDKEDEK